MTHDEAEDFLQQVQRIAVDKSEEPRKVTLGGWKLSALLALVPINVLLAVFMGGWWLYSDKHNDALYVRQEAYEKTRAADKQAHETERASDAALAAQASSQQAQLQALRDRALSDQFAGLNEKISDLRTLLLQKQGIQK